jgi:hypothetical protein
MDEFEKNSKEIDDIFSHFKRIEEQGKEKILYYFDRIHNNLFVFNNLLIAGFFTLAQLKVTVSNWNIIIPIVNLWFLIYIDYRLMEKSRFEAKITEQPQSKIQEYGKTIQTTTLMSLCAIVSTLLITIIFLFLLLKL